MLSLASLAVAASLLIAQRDYKRMLAYSSIEHMGLLALGAAIGSPLAIAAVLLHILGHGLAKSVAVPVSAGPDPAARPGTSRIDGVRGLAARAPVLAGCFGLGDRWRCSAFPPFSLFASELGIARAGFAARARLGHRGRASCWCWSRAPPDRRTPAGCCSAPHRPTADTGRRRGRRTGRLAVAARTAATAAGRRPASAVRRPRRSAARPAAPTCWTPSAARHALTRRMQ